jgi:gas vesicle protein
VYFQVILQILGLRAASKACRAIAQKAISKITDHNELVLVIKMVLQSDSYELLESLKAALMKSQSSKVKNHLKKLREEGIDAFDDVMDAMKSKTSLLSFDSPRPSFEDVVIKARPFISSMSADFLHELEDSIAYDYTLRLAAGQNIQVHKAILAARWPYFGALVNSNMAESRKGTPILSLEPPLIVV